jgi:hypothetical protein
MIDVGGRAASQHAVNLPRAEDLSRIASTFAFPLRMPCVLSNGQPMPAM